MRVLFICKYNAGRSRMAEAFFKKYSKKNEVFSRGIGRNPRLPSSRTGINGSITVMKELGIKIPGGLGSGVTKKDVEDADKVIVLLDKKQMHILPKYVSASPKTEYYEIPDSDARASDYLEQKRRNRDLVKAVVLRLVKRLG